MKKFCITLISIYFSTLLFSSAHAQTWSYADEAIPYFAMIRGNSDRRLLFSNPKLCAQAQKPCNFFLESMSAHGFLNHRVQKPEHYPMLEIKAADCFAVQFVNTEDIFAAYNLMLDPQEAKKFMIAGNLEMRAENLKKCAKKKNKWPGYQKES